MGKVKTTAHLETKVTAILTSKIYKYNVWVCEDTWLFHFFTLHHHLSKLWSWMLTLSCKEMAWQPYFFILVMGGSDLTLVLDGSHEEELNRMFVVMYLEGEANSVMCDCLCLIAFNVPVDVTRQVLNIYCLLLPLTYIKITFLWLP